MKVARDGLLLLTSFAPASALGSRERHLRQEYS